MGDWLEIVEKIRDVLPSKPRKQFEVPLTKNDRKILDYLIDNEGYHLPKDISKEMDISQSRIYDKMKELNDREIVHHKRGDGFRFILPKRVFPVHFFLIGLILVIYGLFAYEFVSVLLGFLLDLVLVLDWKTEYTL